MIIYFSATGNSRHVAKRIAAGAGDVATCIETLINEGVFKLSLKAGEMLAIVSPVYCGGLPKIVRDYLEKLRLDAPADYVCFVATYGTGPGLSDYFASRCLKNAGVSIDASFGVKMPDNWTPVFDLSDPDYVAGLNADADRQIDELLPRILGRDRGDFLRGKPSLEAGLAHYSRYDMLRRTANFAVGEECVGCGLCESRCPDRAIVLEEGRPKWVKELCIMCLGCLHRCPVFAIQYGSSTAAHGQYLHPDEAPGGR